MTNLIKIGMIGLGGIAKKAYLPILSKSSNFEFVGAFTPNEIKRKQICREYRIKEFSSIKDLANECDAVFVHTSTESHYDVIKELLNLGVHVYVDKPLASTVKQGEELISLSQSKNLKIMVGFNRRFAPMYNQVKNSTDNILSVNLCKHSLNSIPSTDFSDTFIDDYIHVIDTALWLCDEDVEITGEDLILTDSNNLVFVGHKLRGNKFSVNTSMSRNSGTKLEQLEVLAFGKIQRVKNLNLLETEIDGSLTTTGPGAWTSILKQKGFEDCINHFIDSITNDTTPIISGEECLKAQRLLEKIIASNSK